MLGIDLGYSSIKVVSEKGRVAFASAIGTPDASRFGLSKGATELLYEGERFFFGDSAVDDSRLVTRREDRHWIESDVYNKLIVAGLYSVVQDESVVNSMMIGRVFPLVVSGLPVAYYSDKDKLIKTLCKPFVFSSNRNTYSVIIKEARVVPQPFGTIFDYLLDEDGEFKNGEDSLKTIGVIDIGGKTTNILVAKKLSEQNRYTTSVNYGGWDVVRAVREYILKEHEIEIRDHEVARMLSTGELIAYGSSIDVKSPIHDAIAPVYAGIRAELSRIWNNGAMIDKILITGGGSLFLGQQIKELYPQSEIVADPVFSNASGYYKFACRLGRK